MDRRARVSQGHRGRMRRPTMNAAATRFADLPFPSSQDEISAIQSTRKRRAVEQARRVPFFGGRLDHVRLDCLDDPEEWRKIPILDKEMLRALSPEQFYREFCLPFDGQLA